MSIDFSRAPEGATHYRELVSGVAWYKADGNGISMASDEDGWFLCGRSLAELTAIPTFETFVSVEDAPTNGSKHDPATAKQASPKGVGAPILGMVLADLTNRALEGRQKYGEPLLAHNGRNPLWDAYQEALDLAMYLRQAIEESK